MTATWEGLAGALTGIPRLEGANCIGLSELFDSLEDDDIHEAIAICECCPALTPCRLWADSLPRSRLEGVVAGKRRWPRKPRPVKPKPNPQQAVPA